MSNPVANEKIISTTIELLGKPYAVRCPEAELAALQNAAVYLNQCMQGMKDATAKGANLERVAMMAALNMAHQLLQGDQQKTTLLDKISQRIQQLHDNLDFRMRATLQAEVV